MKTAVEWLVEEINKLTGLTIQMDEPIIEQAKEMEKEEIKKAWIDGNYNIDSNGNPSENYAISDENYYNQTFKSE
jgi:hypothetical protein